MDIKTADTIAFSSLKTRQKSISKKYKKKRQSEKRETEKETFKFDCVTAECSNKTFGFLLPLLLTPLGNGKLKINVWLNMVVGNYY